MDINLILQILGAVLAAVAIYTLIGFIPGTDETAVIVPITLALVLSGVRAEVNLAFFIAAVVTLSVSNAMPTIVVGLPGGVMSSPMLESSQYLKSKGLSALAIQKLAAGALLGVILALPSSLLMAKLLAPLGGFIKEYASLLFVFGAIFLALLSKSKFISLISIIPLAVLFMSFRHMYWNLGIVSADKNVSISFFLGITVGPLLFSLLEIMNKDTRVRYIRTEEKIITIPKIENKSLNPFKILNISELKKISLSSFISSALFVLSPVGLVLLLGESFNRSKEDKEVAAFGKVSTMSALIQSTYLSGILIPLIALGVPLSPVSIGPGIALFEAEPVYQVGRNIHHILGGNKIALIASASALLAISVVYIFANRFAHKITKFVLKKIPHEAILSLFIAFIILLAYMDAGLLNVIAVLVIGVFSGFLNKLGVNYGVQFMALYASPWIVQQLVSII